MRRTPEKFVEKFSQPQSFQQAARYISVYVIPMNVITKLERTRSGPAPAFLGDVLLPYLRKNHIKLALETGGVKWMENQLRAGDFEPSVNLLARLKRLGAEVNYISLQSLLSKRRNVENYALDRRIQDAVAYAKAVRGIYPNVKIGLIDALPSHGLDYRSPYRKLSDALAHAGIGLSYIHLDISLEAAFRRRGEISWDSIRAVEKYVEGLGVEFGLYAKSRRAGQISSEMFHRRSIEGLECYAGAGGTPHDYIIASWFRYPEKAIPDNATGNDYPLMRTVLDFGRRLDQIEHHGPTSHEGSREWQKQCEPRAG